jgi:glutathione synthase/RimK-type ligase-like ATP-grasp enzyme
MILIVTNKRDHTADYLILELQKRKAEYVRFNTEDYPQKVQLDWRADNTGWGGYLVFPKRKVDLKEINSVWYRRPVPPAPSSEVNDPVVQDFVIAESQASLEGLWRCLDCFWVSHPDNLRRAEYKLYQLKLAREIGFQISPTIITSIPASADKFYSDQECRVAYKPLRRGRILRRDSVSLIYTNLISIEDAKNLDSVVHAPCLLQKYVQKSADIRVTVIGRKAFAVEIHSQDHDESRHDWRRGETAQLRHKPHLLPLGLQRKCLNLVSSLELKFGAIDLILTQDGEYIFLEINANGQWAWIQQLRPEIPLRETLADLLINGANAYSA